MFLFYHLLLAHVTAELALQPKELIDWKKKSIWGVVFHGLIFLVLSAIFCFTYIKNPIFLLTIFAITIARIAIDKIDLFVSRTVRFDNIITFLVDQFFHICVLLPVIFIPGLKEIRFLTDSIFSTIYNSPLLILYLSFFIIVVYGGSFIIYYLKKTFADPNISFGYDYIGMFERLIIFSLFLLGEIWLLFIPLIIIVKSILIFSNIRGDWLKISSPALQYQKIKLKNLITYDLLISPAFTIAMGIILKSL